MEGVVKRYCAVTLTTFLGVVPEPNDIGFEEMRNVDLTRAGGEGSFTFSERGLKR